jgi:hypothetical protein
MSDRANTRTTWQLKNMKSFWIMYLNYTNVLLSVFTSKIKASIPYPAISTVENQSTSNIRHSRENKQSIVNKAVLVDTPIIFTEEPL